MMLVDCQTCPVRDLHCADCIVTALTQLPFPTTNESQGRHHLGVAGSRSSHGSHRTEPTTQTPFGVGDGPDSVPLDRAERRALSILAAVGLVDHETANGARAVVETGRRAVSVPTIETHRRAI
ncbi:MAG: hypothetical protein ABI112_18340 [Terracoccus sp.]